VNWKVHLSKTGGGVIADRNDLSGFPVKPFLQGNWVKNGVLGDLERISSPKTLQIQGFQGRIP